MNQKYVALLRGINVGGQKLIKMELLRQALQQLPFTNVSTYIQSGNILFESNTSDIEKLQTQIHELINNEFALDIPVVVVTANELQTILAKNPYRDKKLDDPAQPYVCILSGKPSKKAQQMLGETDFGNDEWISYERWLYILYESAGRTKLSNSVIEKKLNLTATARNWKTINKLAGLLEVNRS